MLNKRSVALVMMALPLWTTYATFSLMGAERLKASEAQVPVTQTRWDSTKQPLWVVATRDQQTEECVWIGTCSR